MDMVRGARKAFGYRSNLLRDAAHLSAKGVLDQFGAYICQNHTGTLREALFLGGALPGTPCQATIASSLRDISQQTLAREEKRT
jgi:hypothetical protein